MPAATERDLRSLPAAGLRWRLRALGAAVVLLAAGCATISEPQRGHLESESPLVQSCASWFQSLDEAVEAAGVRDAGAYRIPGFPYLRASRFLASFGERAAIQGAEFSDWARRLRELDMTARRFELDNLPEARLREIGADGPRQALARTEACAAELARLDFASPDSRARLVEHAVVPDDYSDAKRGFGLYAIVRHPFASGVERWHEEAETMFRQEKEGGGPARRYERYGPPAGTEAISRDRIKALLRDAPRDALGIPRFSQADREILLAAFAPLYEIDTRGDYDRFGTLSWRDGQAPEVDATRPTAYRRIAFTRYGQDVLVQLVYTIWFSERPSGGAFDLLAGKLDGVVLRVTLTPDGDPLVYDSMHPCGCFHLFFPTSLARPVPAPHAGEEWAFIPTGVTAPGPAQRISVKVATATHYLVGIEPVSPARAYRPYAFADEDELRSVSAGDGGRRSLYGPDGLVPGTERPERMFFWPMGIDSAGAMRQWGRHATAFLGRRHFDDADLIERRFRIEDPR